MPGAKRKLDEDTWIVSQSKKFKQGLQLSSVYETTLAHLRLGARNFFNSLMMRPESPAAGTSSNNVVTPRGGNVSPIGNSFSPPGSPVIRDIIGENEELQILGASMPSPPPAVICQECSFRHRSPLGNEESYGKCAFCDKLVCHLNPCRGCGSGFCGQCTITKYEDSSSESYECYNCLC